MARKKAKAKRSDSLSGAKNFSILIALVLLGILSYFAWSTNQTSSVKQAPITASLAEQNKSKESGNATLSEKNGKVLVTLNLTGTPKNVKQPAHIHAGSCPKVGAVKYPLTTPVDGISETSLDVTLAELKTMKPLAINVHKSEKQANTYVACGDLPL